MSIRSWLLVILIIAPLLLLSISSFQASTQFPIRIAQISPALENCQEPKELKFYSQLGQDQLLFNDFFRNSLRCNGTIVDIGANDGRMLSNSWFFESIGWQSYCVEPNPAMYSRLIVNRPLCHCVNVAIGNRSGTVPFVNAGYLGTLAESGDVKRALDTIYKGDKRRMDLNTVKVRMITSKTLVQIFALKEIDILSIDVEGSELGVVSSFPWDEVYVKAITIEANLETPEKKPAS